MPAERLLIVLMPGKQLARYLPRQVRKCAWWMGNLLRINISALPTTRRPPCKGNNVNVYYIHFMPANFHLRACKGAWT